MNFLIFALSFSHAYKVTRGMPCSHLNVYPPPPTHTLTHIHIERKRNNTSPPPPKDHPKISTDLVEQRFDGLHAPPEFADAGVEGLGLLCGARAGRERDADFLAFFWGGFGNGGGGGGGVMAVVVF